jgi:hypothetical protein
MKLLLLLGDDETYKLMIRYLKPLGFEFIRYTHVLKAMDNIDEISPDAIIVSARDYPRHWKIVANFIRNEKDKDLCPFVLLKGENFPVEEVAKASYLGVSGIIHEVLQDPDEISRLQRILSRYVFADEKRQSRRYYAGGWHQFGFVFIHPESGVLITGQVKDVSSGGLSFQPDNSPLLKNMPPNVELLECSLRIGSDILTPTCRVNRTGKVFSFVFASFPNRELDTLNAYLERLPQD